MAAVGFRFRAHECHPVALRVTLDRLHRGEKGAASRERPIQYVACLIVERRVFRPPTEGTPHPRVPNLFADGARKALPVELRREPRVWR